METFELDHVFSATSSQEDVFRQARDVIVSCIDGYNVCIFAYGQTGIDFHDIPSVHALKVPEKLSPWMVPTAILASTAVLSQSSLMFAPLC